MTDKQQYKDINNYFSIIIIQKAIYTIQQKHKNTNANQCIQLQILL